MYYEEKCDDASFYLIIYDVVDDKRRRRIARTLEGYGVRVQYSSFEVWLSAQKFKELVEKINRIKKSCDSIRIYPLTKESINSKDKELRKIIQCDVIIC